MHTLLLHPVPVHSPHLHQYILTSRVALPGFTDVTLGEIQQARLLWPKARVTLGAIYIFPELNCQYYYSLGQDVIRQLVISSYFLIFAKEIAQEVQFYGQSL